MSDITIAAPPLTPEVAQQILASLASQSGVLTDYNKGSQIRTLAEAIGATEEIAGISAVVLALQVIAYGGMSIFSITPNSAVPATGSVLFTTSLAGSPPPVVQDVVIPSGTLVSTLGGVQFQTTAQATILAGNTGVTVPVVAVNGGLNTNVTAGAINLLLSGLAYPLSVSNAAATTGGLDAETPSQALNRLASKFVSLVGGSPVSVANAAIGVVASGGSESVVYSTCYEGWLDPISPNYPNTAGFNVYIDNGSGSASAALISAVTSKLNGNFLASVAGYRPSGVPYSVLAVVPILANVAVSGTLGPLSNQSQVSGAIAAAVSGYFTKPFGIPASQPEIAAAVGNAALGQLTSLTVNLFYASAPSSAVALVSGARYTRVLLNTLTTTIAPSS